MNKEARTRTNILPIYGYGQPVLKRMGTDIPKGYPGLEELIEAMWNTMRNAKGVGLAAPQIGKSIRLFLVDSTPMYEENEKEKGLQKVFINAKILEESGTPWNYEEGCLSIPQVTGDVERRPRIRIRYMDEQFVEHEEEFEGIEARIIQHEYDHIEGRLFTELLKPVKRRMIKRKLENIRKGKVKVNYPMRFAMK